MHFSWKAIAGTAIGLLAADLLLKAVEPRITAALPNLFPSPGAQQ